VTPSSWTTILDRVSSSNQIPYRNFQRLGNVFIFSDPFQSKYDSIKVVREDELLMSLDGTDYGSRIWISYENYDDEILLNGSVYRAILVGVQKKTKPSVNVT